MYPWDQNSPTLDNRLDPYRIRPSYVLYHFTFTDSLPKLRQLVRDAGVHDVDTLGDCELAELAVELIERGKLCIVGDPEQSETGNAWLKSREQAFDDYVVQSAIALSARAVAETPEQEPPREPKQNSVEPEISKLSWRENRKPLGMPAQGSFSVRNFAAGDVAKIHFYQTPRNGEKQYIETLEIKLAKGTEPCSFIWDVKAIAGGQDQLMPEKSGNVPPVYFLFDVEINGVRSGVSGALYTSTYCDLVVTGPYDLPVAVDDSVASLRANGKKVRDAKFMNGQAGFVGVPLHDAHIESWYEIYKTDLLDKNDKVLAEHKHPLGYKTPYLKLASGKPQYKVHAHALFPQVIVNLREDAPRGDRDTRYTLYPEEIEYFKNNGNNAMIYVHGFNVEYGEAATHIESVNIQNDVRGIYEFEIKKGPQTRTTCLDQARLAKDHDARFSEQDVFNATKKTDINGTGAHGWFLHMEHELNKAAGFTGDNWENYTRIINIAWSGDVFLTNYIDAEAYASAAGIKLARLILQLHKEGIAINIIAHSLGNRVLLQALDCIGRLCAHNKTLEEIVEHAFMWQPACPDTALSNDPDKDTSILGNWKMTHAHLAAKKFVVLYSRSDNVLGEATWEGIKEDMSPGKDKEFHFDEALATLFIAAPYSIASAVGISPKQMIYDPWGSLDIINARVSRNMDREDFWQDFVCDVLGEFAVGAVVDYVKDKIEDQGKHLYVDGSPEGADRKTRKAGITTNIASAIAKGFVKNAYLGDKPPRPAMGWVGVHGIARHNSGGEVDFFVDDLYERGKIVLVDQSNWLHSHSGMKIPSDDIRHYVYKLTVLEKIKPTTGFGKWPRSVNSRE